MHCWSATRPATEPHQARLQGLPRGLLLQAAGRPGAARPARGRAARALRLPELRGVAGSSRRRRGKALETAGWYQEVFGKDNYFMEIQSHGIAEQGLVTEGTLRIARAIGAPLVGHQRLALSGGERRPRPRGAPVHPDRHQPWPTRPVALLDREVLPEVGRRDARGLQGAARGVREHPGRGRAVQLELHVRPVPPAALPGARRATRSTRYLRAPGRRGPRRARYGRLPRRRGRRARLALRARRHREDGLLGLLPGGLGLHPLRAASRASRSGRGAARRPARWSPTASASPTSIRSGTACSSSAS